MIEEIKELYSQITSGKVEFIKMAAADLGKSPRTLRNHWFAEFWSIPEDHQPRIKELLEQTIAKQEVTA